MLKVESGDDREVGLEVVCGFSSRDGSSMSKYSKGVVKVISDDSIV